MVDHRPKRALIDEGVGTSNIVPEPDCASSPEGRDTTPLLTSASIASEPLSTTTGANEVSEDVASGALSTWPKADLSDNAPAGRSAYGPTTWGEGRTRGTGDLPSTSTSSGGAGRGPMVAPTITPLVSERPRARVTLDCHVDVRVTRAERDDLRQRAARLGISPSVFVRAVVRDSLDGHRHEVDALYRGARFMEPPVKYVDPVLVEQLRRVGQNLNQTLRRGLTVDEVLLRDVKRVVDEALAAAREGGWE